MQHAYKILVWKSERKRLFGRRKRRWEGNTGCRVWRCGPDSCLSGWDPEAGSCGSWWPL